MPSLLEFARRQAKAAVTGEAAANSPLLINVLVQFPGAESAEAIALQLREAAARGAAVQALLKFGPVAGDAVLPYLNDRDPDVHKEARSLCRLLNVADDRLFAQTLADVAGAQKSRSRVALQHLGKLRQDPTHLAAVSKAINAPLLDPDREIADSALEAALVWGTPENTATLLKLFGDCAAGARSARSLRPKGQRALSAIGPSVEDGLIPHLRSPSGLVRSMACRILAEVARARA